MMGGGARQKQLQKGHNIPRMGSATLRESIAKTVSTAQIRARRCHSKSNAILLQALHSILLKLLAEIEWTYCR